MIAPEKSAPGQCCWLRATRELPCDKQATHGFISLPTDKALPRQCEFHIAQVPSWLPPRWVCMARNLIYMFATKFSRRTLPKWHLLLRGLLITGALLHCGSAARTNSVTALFQHASTSQHNCRAAGEHLLVLASFFPV